MDRFHKRDPGHKVEYPISFLPLAHNRKTGTTKNTSTIHGQELSAKRILKIFRIQVKGHGPRNGSCPLSITDTPVCIIPLSRYVTNDRRTPIAKAINERIGPGVLISSHTKESSAPVW